MQCFVHGEVAAVGLCKNCHRGVCHDCTAETAGGVACKGRCEQAVVDTDELVRRNVISGQGAGPLQFLLMVGSAIGGIYLAYAAIHSAGKGSLVGAMLYGGVSLFFLGMAGIFGRAFVAAIRARAR